jgi:hypothetical protein
MVWFSTQKKSPQLRSKRGNTQTLSGLQYANDLTFKNEQYPNVQTLSGGSYFLNLTFNGDFGGDKIGDN